MAEPRHIQRPNLHPRGFKFAATLPYDLRVAEVRAALEDLYDFLYNVNTFLTGRGWERLEEALSGATFSAVMSETVVQSLSKQSKNLTKNRRHNGRPDLVPEGTYPGEAVLAGPEGIEVKASRYESGWQGHNAEQGWIMVFQYHLDIETSPSEHRSPTTFERVLIAQLDSEDWSFSGRGVGSRRTPTASIRRSGVNKLVGNAIYIDPVYASAGRSKAKT